MVCKYVGTNLQLCTLLFNNLSLTNFGFRSSVQLELNMKHDHYPETTESRSIWGSTAGVEDVITCKT